MDYYVSTSIRLDMILHCFVTSCSDDEDWKLEAEAEAWVYLKEPDAKPEVEVKIYVQMVSLPLKYYM